MYWRSQRSPFITLSSVYRLRVSPAVPAVGLYSLAVLVALIKVAALAHTSPGIGMYAMGMLVVLFALLFDLTIALGRSREGVATAAQDRFTMPSILLIVGVVAYAWARLPSPRSTLFATP